MLLQIFAKAPVIGQVKTRIAKTHGKAFALQLHRRLCEHMIAMALQSNVGAVEVWTTDARALGYFEALGVDCCLQQGQNLGTRMDFALRHGLARHDRVVIVGADAATDADIVGKASRLYDNFRLRRVYYSAFSPIPDASAVLPLKRPPLIREHRLYQSDWLMRFYGYKPAEVMQATEADGNLPLDIDPKLAWALKFREQFPVDVNRATKEQLLRVPGLGVKAVGKILASRRHRNLRLDDVARLTLSVTKVRPFICTVDWRPVMLTDRADLRSLLAPKTEQLELFTA